MENKKKRGYYKDPNRKVKVRYETVKVSLPLETFLKEKKLLKVFKERVVSLNPHVDFEIKDIYSAFPFDKTKEGFEYWNELAKEFEPIFFLNNPHF